MNRSSLFHWIVLLLIVGAAIGVLTVKRDAFRSFFLLDQDDPGTAEDDLRTAIGTKLGELRLAPLVGKSKPVTLDSLAKRVTLINFWGTWCPPCIEEFPHLADLEKRMRDHPDFRMISVSCGPGADTNEAELREQTKAFLAQQEFGAPVYWDPDGFSRQALMQSAQIDFAYPFTIVVDAEGRIAGAWRGYLDGYTLEMEKVVRELLGKKK